MIAEYNRDFTASSLNELRLGAETLGGEAHSYCPAYTDDTIDQYLALSTHITFNSISQAARFCTSGCQGRGERRPESQPCLLGDRHRHLQSGPAGIKIRVTALQLEESGLPEGIEGFHFHALCESSSYDLEKVLNAFEKQFGKYLDSLRWVNMGGGHLMTREGYDTDHLVELIKRLPLPPSQY